MFQLKTNRGCSPQRTGGEDLLGLRLHRQGRRGKAKTFAAAAVGTTRGAAKRGQMTNKTLVVQSCSKATPPESKNAGKVRVSKKQKHLEVLKTDQRPLSLKRRTHALCRGGGTGRYWNPGQKSSRAPRRHPFDGMGTYSTEEGKLVQKEAIDGAGGNRLRPSKTGYPHSESKEKN